MKVTDEAFLVLQMQVGLQMFISAEHSVTYVCHTEKRCTRSPHLIHTLRHRLIGETPSIF